MVTNTLEQSVGHHHLLANELGQVPDDAGAVGGSRHALFIVFRNLPEKKWSTGKQLLAANYFLRRSRRRR